jgi:hypothetical protein
MRADSNKSAATSCTHMPMDMKSDDIALDYNAKEVTDGMVTDRGLSGA